MKLFNLIFLVLIVVLARADDDNATPYVQCAGEHFDDLENRVQVIPCGPDKCKLQRGTNVTVNLRFQPKNYVTKLTNHVYGKVMGMKMPFVGVDGKSACENIVHAADGSPAPCPLQAGEEYKYTNVFHIEKYYPSINVQVHWALNDGTNDVICFEVSAVITGA